MQTASESLDSMFAEVWAVIYAQPHWSKGYSTSWLPALDELDRLHSEAMKG